MTIKEGDKLKHKLNKHLYQVVMIKRGTVVLKSIKGSPIRLWFGTEDVQNFFEMMKRR